MNVKEMMASFTKNLACLEPTWQMIREHESLQMTAWTHCSHLVLKYHVQLHDHPNAGARRAQTIVSSSGKELSQNLTGCSVWLEDTVLRFSTVSSVHVHC